MVEQSMKRDQSAPGRRPHGGSLRATLVAAFVLLSVIPVAVTMNFAIARATSQAEQQVSDQLISIAEAKQAALETEVGHIRTGLAATVADPDDYAEIVTFAGAAEADPELQGRITTRLAASLNTLDEFDEFFVYDLDGDIIASTDSRQVGKVVLRAPYFEHSLTEVYVQPPFYELGSADLNMVVTLPLLNPQAKPVGVLAGRVNMNHLGEVMAERAGLRETGETYLVSLENNYLVTPSRFEGYPLTRSYHSEGIDRALAGHDGFGLYDSYRGVLTFGAYRWLPDLQVGLVVEMERAEATALLQQTIRFTLVLGTLTAVLAAALGLVIAIRITRPIGKLTQVTQAFAAGDLARRVEARERNEIGALGEAFNSMAAQLEESLTALEQSVQEARMATAMAREANRLKSEFLSTMSHELRTPLNAIIGFTEILMTGMSGALTDKQQHKISRIHLNSKRLLDLINDLLDLAKIEAGRVDVLAQPFSPRDLALGIKAQMESLAEQKGLNFETHVDPALPPVIVGDAARIEQATKNLLSNALKFTPEGSVKLAIHANGGHSWEIAVSDTGIGIPPHALEYIFDEFRQVDGTSQRAYGGSGLGLAITRNLARVMGGEVRVASTVGKGSTFTITLPLHTPAETGVTALS